MCYRTTYVVMCIKGETHCPPGDHIDQPLRRDCRRRGRRCGPSTPLHRTSARRPALPSLGSSRVQRVPHARCIRASSTAAAKRRLDQAADALVATLLGIALDGDVPDAVALAVIRDTLDRAGLVTPRTLDLSFGQHTVFAHTGVELLVQCRVVADVVADQQCGGSRCSMVPVTITFSGWGRGPPVFVCLLALEIPAGKRCESAMVWARSSFRPTRQGSAV